MPSRCTSRFNCAAIAMVESKSSSLSQSDRRVSTSTTLTFCAFSSRIVDSISSSSGSSPNEAFASRACRLHSPNPSTPVYNGGGVGGRSVVRFRGIGVGGREGAEEQSAAPRAHAPRVSALPWSARRRLMRRRSQASQRGLVFISRSPGPHTSASERGDSAPCFPLGFYRTGTRLALIDVGEHRGALHQQQADQSFQALPGLRVPHVRPASESPVGG